MEKKKDGTAKEKKDPLTNSQEIDKNKNIKYPFSGVAPNLIDKFLVVAYEQKTIENTLRTGNIEPKSDFKARYLFFEFEERPHIVNEICNDYSKDLLDNDLILELIFPNFPQMYLLEKQYINTPREPDEELLISTYSIIFSINPQDNSGSKKSYNGLGYVFYIPSEQRNINGQLEGIYYVPMAYVILSEFPYFYHFNEICKNVYLQMKKETDEIPIDIILYNTIKYAPSPINKSINLSFGALFGFPQGKDNKIETILSSLNQNASKEKKGIPTLFFNQLSGYPFMDVNISFIFNLIPPEIIVEVFIFSFLEHDIIFYSSRPEILNMVMYIFSSFNYPFNDSIYYWHILSVSQDSFMSGTSTFVGKTCSTITGILSEYDKDLLTTKKIREHFVLDIDNKNFFFLYQEETDEVKETMDLYTYIKNCAAEVDEITGEVKKMDKEFRLKNYFNDGIQLYDVIKNLMEELQRRAKKVTSTNYNERLIKPTFLDIYEDESEMECIKANLRLQKAFFTFITQILQNFVKILSIGEEIKERENLSESRIPSIVVNIKKEEINEEEETKRKLAKRAGRIFKEKFQDCSKYSSFVINFCKFHDTIDLYKIPYTFINEFIYYSHVAVRNNLSEVDVFKLIDQFYGRKKMIDFEELIKENEKESKKIENKKEEAKKEELKKKNEKSNKKEKNKKNNKKDLINDNNENKMTEDINNIMETDLENIYLFTFDKFVDFYKDKLRAYINREQEDDREMFTKVKQANKQFKKYKRNNFYLSNRILNIYSIFSNNHTNELINTFELIKCEYQLLPEDNDIKDNASKSKNKIDNEKNNENENNNKIIIKNKSINNIDYYYYLKEKQNLKDKLERDIKLFGTYEFMEITDVIEHHFILERCFSSYGLIKFSLLNILALTRGIEGLKINNRYVINTMCDFCGKTKSLVRKYMNIFLNIFQNMKTRNILKDLEECDQCLNIITLYFKKTNMIPTEETTKSLNEIKETEKNKSNKDNQSSTSSNEQMDEANLKKYVEEKGKFFEMKDGFMQTNTRKKFEDSLKTIETVFSGIYKAGVFNFDYKELDKQYDAIKIKKEKFIPLTPLNLYSRTNKLLYNYLKIFSIDMKIYKELYRDILSLLFYFKIPIIGLKWNDQYRPDDRIRNSISIKTPHKDKNPKKRESNSNQEERNKKMETMNDILKKIISILNDLLEVIKKDIKQNN